MSLIISQPWTPCSGWKGALRPISSLSPCPISPPAPCWRIASLRCHPTDIKDFHAKTSSDAPSDAGRDRGQPRQVEEPAWEERLKGSTSQKLLFFPPGRRESHSQAWLPADGPVMGTEAPAKLSLPCLRRRPLGCACRRCLWTSPARSQQREPCSAGWPPGQGWSGHPDFGRCAPLESREGFQRSRRRARPATKGENTHLCTPVQERGK